MPYDPNQMMGLTALSPTVAAYKQFMERQNNVGDSNIVPFLVSRGEPQLAGLIAKKLRVENAAKSQQQLAQQPPAAPPTVADQYDMAAQQQAMMAPGLPGMPNPAMDRASFAGGGIVAFQGGGFGEYVSPPTAEDLLNLERKAAQGDTKAAQLLKYLRQQFTTAPTLGKLATKTGSGLLGLAGKTLRGAPYIGATAGAADLAQSDPEYIQRTSRLAQLGMDVNPENKIKTGAATFMGVLESALPTGLLYKTPAERAKEEREKAIAPGVEFAGSADDLAMVRQLQALKKQYGANSPEVAAFEAAARSTRGMTTAPPAPSAGAELDKYLGLGATPEGRARKPAASTTAPAAATPAAPAPDPLAELRASIEKLKPTKPEKTAVVSKALDEEAAFIKARQEEAGVSKKQASTEFLINLGASLLANRSPQFTVALGEALKESYGTMSQNLRELKKDNDALKLQELKVQAAREQLQRDQDSESEKYYNDQLKTYNTYLTQLEIKKLELANDVTERQSRERQAAEDRASAENIARMRLYDPAQEQSEKYYKFMQAANDPKLSPQVRAEALRRAEAILAATQALTSAGSGAAQAALVRAQNQPNLYAIGAGSEASTEGWGDVSIR